jgi:hypothetical protein
MSSVDATSTANIISAFPHRFAGLKDLARLPWFEVRDDRLVVVDPTITRAIDMHTHLALAYVRPMAVDLTASHPHVEHYLPADVDLDLDVYVNKNFRDHDLQRMNRDLILGSLTASGLRRTHTVPNLVREMGELSIAQSVLLPIEMPRPLSDNTRRWLQAVHDVAADEQIVCFGSVHPYTWHMEAQLDEQVRLGVRGIGTEAFVLQHLIPAMADPASEPAGLVQMLAYAKRAAAVIPDLAGGRLERAMRSAGALLVDARGRTAPAGSRPLHFGPGYGRHHVDARRILPPHAAEGDDERFAMWPTVSDGYVEQDGDVEGWVRLLRALGVTAFVQVRGLSLASCTLESLLPDMLLHCHIINC